MERRVEIVSRRLLVLAWLLGATVAASPTLAQDAAPTEGMSDSIATEDEMTDARARARFRVGRELYADGEFSEAATEFEAAYGLSGRPELLYNIYLAHRDAQNHEAALDALRNYLNLVPEAPDRAHLEARLVALEAEVNAAREAAAATEAERAAAAAELEAARLAAEEAGRPQYRHYAGETWTWAVLGLGGAAAIAGAIVGGVALSERGVLDSQCPGMLCPAGFGLDGRRSNIESLAIASDVLLIGGSVIAVTGLVLGLTIGLDRDELIRRTVDAGSAEDTEGDAAPAPPPAEPAPTAAVSGFCTGDGCMAVVGGTF
jgi:hypothetical protein